MTPEQIAVVEKVQKLLALADNNPNEHEAEAATSKAMDLLSAYNLSMHQVGKRNTASDGKRQDKQRKGGLYGWQRELWESTAKLNFCMYWSIKGLKAGSTYEHRLLGSEVNVISTEVMADYLQKAVERNAQTWAKERGLNVFCRDAIAFREGMARAISGRLNRMRDAKLAADKAEREAHPSNGTDLVLVDVINAEEDYNTDYLNGWEPGTSAQRRAEANAKQAAAMARYQASQDEHKRKMEEDPEYAAKHKAQEKANEEYWESLVAKSRKKGEAADRRRAKNAGKPGYDDAGYKIQYRSLTPAEKRERLLAFGAGYDEGLEVGLDKQVDEKAKPKGLK